MNIFRDIFRDYGKYIGACIVIYVFVFLSVLFSGFPPWRFAGPFQFNPGEYPYRTCLAITGLVVFITVLLFDELAPRNFLATSALNGFAYNSTIMNWVTKAKGDDSENLSTSNAAYFLASWDASITGNPESTFSAIGPIIISIIFIVFTILLIGFKRKKRMQRSAQFKVILVRDMLRKYKNIDEAIENLDENIKTMRDRDFLK